MPTLLETQYALRAMIFAPLESALTRTATPELDPERVAIYRNNCRRALARALSISYAAIERLVGTAFFERAAYAFIDKCLPRSACLDDYGTSRSRGKSRGRSRDADFDDDYSSSARSRKSRRRDDDDY